MFDTAEVKTMAQAYADAWCSHKPSSVAGFYPEDGQISVNGAEPVKGRPGIEALMTGFYNDFPDLKVQLDECRSAGRDAIFAWTLTGTHSGTGNKVAISGWEAWTLTEDLQIGVSRSYFNAEEYARQIAEGV
ncbi:MAG: nuclear transport factor 2 family protein [Pseudomonadota bacterium]